MPRIARSQILDAASARMIARGEPIIGGGAGTGLSAKCEEAGGIDLIVIYNSGRYRMAGPRLARGPARLRQRERDRGRHGARGAAGGAAHAGARRRQRHRPVPAARRFPAAARRRSASPACRTFPTVGLIDGVFRANLEETGMGYGLEVEHDPRRARARPPDHAVRVLRGRTRARWRAPAPTSSSATSGLTTGGAIGAETAVTLADCVPRIDAWAAAARAGEPRRDRAVPRRPDRHARRRRATS